MKINVRIRAKAEACLRDRRSFIIYREEGLTPKIITETNAPVDAYIVPWNRTFNHAVHVGEQYPTAAVRLPQSTSRMQYIKRVGYLVDKLQKADTEYTKTVISRVIAGQSPGIDWIDTAERLWNHFPSSFGFLFYTPATGAWLGASPEKLLTFTAPDIFSTYALAGTLPVGQDWNVKNYQEQQMVGDFIKERLSHLGIKFTELPTKSQQYGTIKHLLTAYTGKIDQQRIPDVLDSLAPTPALSGLPRENSIDSIDDLEDHQRECYGGYILLSADKYIHSYVTIRCLQFDPADDRWAMYVGGGITPKSDPEAEWVETHAKAAAFLDILQASDKENE